MVKDVKIVAGETDPQIGGRIRRLRRQARITQADLAQRLGVSASYLNMIEHNRRKLTVPLLFGLAGIFGIEPGELAECDDARLTGDLMELFGDEIFVDTDVTNQDIRDFAQSNPPVARAVMRLFDEYRRLSDQRGTLRSEETAPFHRATEAISDFLQENANHFPTLEDAAKRVRRDVDAASDTFEIGLRAWLNNVWGLDWRRVSLPPGTGRRPSADGRTLQVSELLPRESALFTVCHYLGGLAASEAIEAIIESAGLTVGDAPDLARNVLASYFAGALMMPYLPFLSACTETRYDIDSIARRFGASFEQVCHRMTTLQRPGALGVPMHLIRTDIAGNISKRFSLSGIHIPRYAGACPRWNVYAAFLQHGRINVQISQMPDGGTYFCVARSLEKGGYRHNDPRRVFSIGLGCDIAHAKRLVYSDGLDLTDTAQIVPIGVSCRICPRMNCAERAHPPADHRFSTEHGMRGETLYRGMAPSFGGA